MKKKQWITVGSIVILIIAGIIGYVLLKPPSSSDSSDETANTQQKEQNENPQYEEVRPIVLAEGEIKRYMEKPWKFKFSKDMNKSTIRKENLNLYAVGLSLGSQGQKALSNEKMDDWTFSYDSSSKILTITVPDWEPMVCASCVYELEFTEKIKDNTGLTLVKSSFEDI